MNLPQNFSCGKAALDLKGKAGFLPLSQKPGSKPAEFWDGLGILKVISRSLYKEGPRRRLSFLVEGCRGRGITKYEGKYSPSGRNYQRMKALF
jgi:hypothetical protein